MSATVATVKLCAIEGCGKAAKNGRGRYCSAHSERRRLYGDPLGRAPVTRPWRGRPCIVPGCDRPSRTLGLCKLHVQRAYAHGGDPLAGRWSPAIPPGHERTAPVDLLDTYTPPHASDPEPVRQLRRELRSLQGARVPFPVAWPRTRSSGLTCTPGAKPWRSRTTSGEPPTSASRPCCRSACPTRGTPWRSSPTW